jgi:phage shock protein E
MLNKLKNILGIKPKADIRELIQKGAVIIDVRSKGEYAGGHVRGSVNIPLNVLNGNLGKFKDKTAPIITCCASGMRSASAKSILKGAGYTNVHNGGSWVSLNNKI